MICPIQGQSLSRRQASHRPWPVYVKGSPTLASSAMELITILNRCQHFPGFVCQHARFSSDHKSIDIDVRPRRGSRAVCSRCHQLAPGYDQLAERRFEFIPLWGFSEPEPWLLRGAPPSLFVPPRSKILLLQSFGYRQAPRRRSPVRKKPSGVFSSGDGIIPRCFYWAASPDIGCP